MAPLMWVDDMLNTCETLAQARHSNAKVNILLKQRGLSLNKEKSVCLIIGTKTQKTKASMELKETPLRCGDFETKEKEDEKWLGQYISARGLAASVEKTVVSREGKIRAAGRDCKYSRRLEISSCRRAGHSTSSMAGMLHPLPAGWKWSVGRDEQEH